MKLSRRTSFSAQNPRVDVVFNAVSGTRDPARDVQLVRNVLTKSFERVLIWHTSAQKDGRQLAEEAIRDGARVLVACGGDGTVTAVATAIHDAQQRRRQAAEETGETVRQGEHTRFVLGVVPRGTANAFCNALDIPTNVRRAAKMIATGCVRRVDLPVVSIEGRSERMLLLAGIGLEARAISRTARRMKRMFGVLAYGWCGVGSIWRQKSFRSEIVLTDVSDSVPFARGELRADKVVLSDMVLKGVTVANAAPVTSVLAHGIGTIKPDDGLLELVCVASESPWATVRTLLHMLRCALLRVREPLRSVFGLRARVVSVRCWPPQRVVVDGETVGFTPIAVSLRGESDSIDVVAPKAGLVNRRRRRLSRALVRLWRNVRGAGVLAVAVVLLRTRTSSKTAA